MKLSLRTNGIRNQSGDNRSKFIYQCLALDHCFMWDGASQTQVSISLVSLSTGISRVNTLISKMKLSSIEFMDLISSVLSLATVQEA